MNSENISVMRLVIAGFNGILFVVGIYIVYEVLKLRPRRLRERLAWLVNEATKLENKNFDNGSINDESVSSKSEDEEDLTLQEINKDIQRIHKAMFNYTQQPKVLLNAAMGFLMIAVSIFAMFNLLIPSFRLFM